MKCTTGLSAHQFAELTQWISQSKPLHTIPTILGVAGSLQATLTYLRHNLPQAAIGELLGVSQPTVSRAVKALTELVTRALDGYLITAEEVAPGCDYILDGTLMPCWSWKAHPALVGQAQAHRAQHPGPGHPRRSSGVGLGSLPGIHP